MRAWPLLTVLIVILSPLNARADIQTSNLSPKIKEGLLVDDSILDRRLPGLERGPIGTIHAIVLHRTNANSAAETLNAYARQENAAHFLIDKDGQIFQTVSLNKKSWHVGRIKSRCLAEAKCSKIENDNLLQIKKSAHSQTDYEYKLHAHEMHKPYPLRYPGNEDSIGIEVVGKYDAVYGYSAPTDAELKSLKYLVENLKRYFHLQKQDIYPHGLIGHHKPSEGLYLGY